MSHTTTQTNGTKTLIVTETVRYEFAVPAAMPEDGDAPRRFFADKAGPWTEADFAAVTEREFELQRVLDDSKPVGPAFQDR